MTDKPQHNDENLSAEPLDAEEASVSEVNETEAQIKEQFDRILRLQADMENMKRRSERDIASAHKYAVEKLVKDLLAVVDSLEMAMQSAHTAENKALLEGINLTHKLFIDTLAKQGVEVINPEGALFDPERHQAVSMQPNPNVDPNTVIQVMQNGYSLNGRLVRPAMVVVSQ